MTLMLTPKSIPAEKALPQTQEAGVGLSVAKSLLPPFDTRQCVELTGTPSAGIRQPSASRTHGLGVDLTPALVCTSNHLHGR